MALELGTASAPLAPAAADPRDDPHAVARALRAGGTPWVSVLESALDLDGLGRFSFVLGRPAAVAIAEAGLPLRRVAGPAGLDRLLAARAEDPLAAAAALLDALGPGAPPPAPFPFAGGALIALGFDLGRRYERLPGRAAADADAPDLVVAVYPRALAFDRRTGEARLVGAGPGGLTADEADAARAAATPLGADGRATQLERASLPRDAYRQAVNTARAWIRRGDLFEVNLTRRHVVRGVEPDLLFARLRARCPAPFMADLDLGRGRRLLSASPERFLQASAAGQVTAWPIKGTRPRGADPVEDARLARDLLESEKDGAELAMIVDLMRSDLGRVARPGSVRVVDPRRLQSWPAVHHTVGVVSADLEPGRTWADLLRATFPPGSVTGAPKVRALEVIDALEPVRRGLYCGAFGWVGWDGALDLAVAIRVAACEGGRALVHAGGAVLLDSDPVAEEREAAAKARALLDAAREAGR